MICSIPIRETVPIASLCLKDEELCAEAISEERIAYAIEFVAEDFGELVELCGWKTTSIDEALAANRSSPRRPLQTLRKSLAGTGRRLSGEFSTEWMHRWLDDPHPQLDGQTPRQAAAGAGRADVARLMRQLENNAERARRRGDPVVDVSQLRDELDLGDELAA